MKGGFNFRNFRRLNLPFENLSSIWPPSHESVEILREKKEANKFLDDSVVAATVEHLFEQPIIFFGTGYKAVSILFPPIRQRAPKNFEFIYIYATEDRIRKKEFFLCATL